MLISADAIASYAREAGFEGEGLVWAVAVALAESGGETAARNVNTDAHRSADRGLWQINDYWHPEWSDAQCDDPAACARAAFAISRGGSDWKPWSTYNDGAAARHLDRARAAAGAPGPATPTPPAPAPTTPKQEEPMPTLYPYKGVRLDARTLAMMNAVDRLTPTISVVPAQGGYNPGGVAASAGTHDRAAIDLKTKHLVAAQKTALERVMEAVGFAVWFRPYNWNGRGGGEHLHAVPIGGDLSAGAQRQVKAYKAGRDGLVRNRPYPRPAGWRPTTWEQYLAAHVAAKTATRVSLQRTYTGPHPRPILAVDGDFGPKSVKSLQEFLWNQIPNDGIWGVRTLRSLQAWLGVPVDGKFGPVTCRALCAEIGMKKPYPTDWVLRRPGGDPVSRALQEYLNKHRG